MKRKGYELSPISMLLEEFDATQNRLARENRLMEKRLAKQAKRERAQKLRKLAERARSAHELAKSEDKCPSPGSRVIQIETAPLFETTMSNSCHDSVADTARDPSTSPDSVNFRLSQQWRHKDSRLDKVSNSNYSGELEMRMGMMERNVLRHQVSFLEQLWSAIKRIRLPMNPNSTVRLVWDFVGLFLISWDVLYIPFELAFDPEENPAASTSGQLAFVSPSAMVNCFKSHPRPWFYARTYAMKYVRVLNRMSVARLSDIHTVEEEEVKVMAAESAELQKMS